MRENTIAALDEERVPIEETAQKPIKPENAKKRLNQLENIQGLCFACIPLVGFCFFTLIPALIAFSAQFTTMDGFDFTTMAWNNFASFGTVLSDPLFWQSFGTDLFLRVRISKRMAELNISPKDLKPPWQCKKCSDSGFLPNGRQCSCYPKKRR